MKALSLKLDDSVFTETEQLITHIKKSRNRYINEALDYYNKVQKRKLLVRVRKSHRDWSFPNDARKRANLR